ARHLSVVLHPALAPPPRALPPYPLVARCRLTPKWGTASNSSACLAPLTAVTNVIFWRWPGESQCRRGLRARRAVGGLPAGSCRPCPHARRGSAWVGQYA